MDAFATGGWRRSSRNFPISSVRNSHIVAKRYGAAPGARSRQSAARRSEAVARQRPSAKRYVTVRSSNASAAASSSKPTYSGDGRQRRRSTGCRCRCAMRTAQMVQRSNPRRWFCRLRTATPNVRNHKDITHCADNRAVISAAPTAK